ncbi:MAG: HDOD domain-containing protein [Nitrospirae bacterium]|nr:HDOD domain-containing protein [Nitrospirota bacterium]
MDIKRAEELVKGIGIPSQMGIVIAINEETSRPNPNFGRISDLIGQDVGLAAKVLKIANSPFFGGRPVDSIHQALNMMGMSNFSNVIMSSALRDVCGDADDSFWSHSMFVAKISAYIAKKTQLTTENQAYLLGLFHDCAIPLLLKKFPNYKQVLDTAIGYSFDSMEKEEAVVQSDHCTVGGLIAKSWKLPDVIYQTIQAHHNDKASHKDPAVVKAMAILVLSEYIAGCYVIESFKVDSDHNWGSRYKETLAELSIDADDVKDFMEDTFELLNKMNPFSMMKKSSKAK